MPIIPTLRRPRKKDLEFEASLSYMENLKPALATWQNPVAKRKELKRWPSW